MRLNNDVIHMIMTNKQLDITCKTCFFPDLGKFRFIIFLKLHCGVSKRIRHTKQKLILIVDRLRSFLLLSYK